VSGPNSINSGGEYGARGRTSQAVKKGEKEGFYSLVTGSGGWSVISVFNWQNKIYEQQFY